MDSVSNRFRMGSFVVVAFMAAATTFSTTLFLDQRDVLKRHIVKEASSIRWFVFLSGAGAKSQVEELVGTQTGLRSLRFISQEEALGAVSQDPALSQSLTLTGQNPFPSSFEVEWSPFSLRVDFLDDVARKVEGLDGVDRVRYDRDRVARLRLLQKFLYQLEFVFLSIVWTAAFLLVFLMGRLVFYTQGPVPGKYLGLLLVVGLLASGLGMAGAYHFVLDVYWRVLVGGGGAAALLGLFQVSSD